MISRLFRRKASKSDDGPEEERNKYQRQEQQRKHMQINIFEAENDNDEDEGKESIESDNGNANLSLKDRFIRSAKMFANLKEGVGKRFTTIEGIALKKGDRKIFIYHLKDELPAVRALRISSNIVDNKGVYLTPEKYELFLGFQTIPTFEEYDKRSIVVTARTASKGNKIFYSRDIDFMDPQPGRFFIMVFAFKSFTNLLLTINLDFDDTAEKPNSQLKPPQQSNNTLQIPAF